MFLLGNDWDNALSPFISESQWDGLLQRTQRLYQTESVFPPYSQLFRAFSLTPFSKVRAVILGQDPYHGPGQANGLAFSVSSDVRIPPSLRNIFRELEADCKIEPPANGDLTPWAQRGVLLLNTVLTVRAGCPNSHRGIGWELLTDAVLNALNKKEDPVVFFLWGSSARSKKIYLTNPHHLILEAAHPSPLSASRGFFGCRHFSAASHFLQTSGFTLNWDLPAKKEIL
ncbi:MAG: uracil-DNA glycosylase [Candidatus Merdivicinus sp.]